jgi:hypothetical protein
MHYGSGQLKGGASDSTQKFSAIMSIVTNNKLCNSDLIIAGSKQSEDIWDI